MELPKQDVRDQAEAKPKIFGKIIESCTGFAEFERNLVQYWKINGKTIVVSGPVTLQSYHTTFFSEKKSVGSKRKISYFERVMEMHVHSFTEKDISNTFL